MLKLNKTYNMDCMEGMKEFPNNYFELAIVDPPYGNNISNIKSLDYTGRTLPKYNMKNWDQQIPDEKYFKELQRVSKVQIICGINYFAEHIHKKYTPIFWDKLNGDSMFGDGELLGIIGYRKTRIFRHAYIGKYHFDNYPRIHPTQKPVALYGWLLNKYAKKGDKIIDTHLGSGSIIIACIKLGFEYIGFEIDTEYYEAMIKRLEVFMKQLDLFRSC